MGSVGHRWRVTTLRVAVLALVWGSGFLWIKLALNGGLSPVQITVVRSALGSLFLLVMCYLFRAALPRGRATWGRLVIAALFCNALPFALFAIGERTVDSGVAGVLNATTPLWSLLLAMMLGTAERGVGMRLGLLIGFAGVLLIFAPWRQSHVFTWGALPLLGAAASYAVGFAYMARKLTGRGTQPVALAAAQLMTATGLGTLALPLPIEGNGVGVTLTGVLAVAILGIFGTGLTFYLSYRLIADEGPTSAATVGYLLPVVSVALGAIFLDEELSLRVVVGMLVVLGGVALTRWRGGAVGVDHKSGPQDRRSGSHGDDIRSQRRVPD